MMFAKLFFWGLLALPLLAVAGGFGMLGRRRNTRSQDPGPTHDAEDGR